MNKTTILIHIANFAEVVALVARELASTPEQAASPAYEASTEALMQTRTGPKKRGPKPKAEQQPEVKTDTQPEPPVVTDPQREESGLTRDDLRLLFEPVVKRGDGPKVKEALKKYGVEKLADLEAKDFDLFGRDIADLLTPNEQVEFIAAGHPYFPK